MPCPLWRPGLTYFAQTKIILYLSMYSTKIVVLRPTYFQKILLGPKIFRPTEGYGPEKQFLMR